MTSLNLPHAFKVAVIGGGPAGLMAAETLAAGGVQVALYDAMPSVGRKFLLAGKGGMNLTHSEPYQTFLTRYAARQPQISPLLNQFGPDALRNWVHTLGINTFIGSSGRVFPHDMKAAPLLRAWLHRLRQAGVTFHMRHRWLGWSKDGALSFATPEGPQTINTDAVLLALGGGSWPRLGSNGAWMPLLAEQAIPLAPLQPSNCGFDIGWSTHFQDRFAGHHLKSVALMLADPDHPNDPPWRQQGECIITTNGIEGGLIYTLSARLRDHIAHHGNVSLLFDLLPDWPLQRVLDAVAHPRGARSWSSHLQSRLGLKGVKTALLRELVSASDFVEPNRLAHRIKALSCTLRAARPIDEAISSAGGVDFTALDQHLMLHALPGVFCAGEMLDWEAPTGGYLLTACFASGHVAAKGMLKWLQQA